MFDLRRSTLKFIVPIQHDDPKKPFTVEHGCCSEAERMALKREEAALHDAYVAILDEVKTKKDAGADEGLSMSEQAALTRRIEEATDRYFADVFDVHARFASRHVVALHNVTAGGEPVPWNEEKLEAMGTSRAGVLKQLGLGDAVCRANLSKLCSHIIDGLKAVEKND